MRIGLLGGSFNPIHNAHLRVAAEVRAACRLDRVIFIPAADPPHKILAGGVSFEQRATMVRMAIAGRPGFEMSSVEAERSGKSYSIDTICIFRERFAGNEFFFIIGGDSFLEIGTWHRYAEIFPLCNLVVVERPGCPVNNRLEALPEAVRRMFVADSKTGNLIHVSGSNILFVTGTPQALSSTEIRHRAAENFDITAYLPQDVAAYISQQRIYHQCQ